MTCRASFAVAIGFPSSETPTIPASFMAAISAIASPLLPTDAAPIGHTRTLPATFARSTMNRVTEALSFTGFVFGMQQTAVNPPRAAARVPVSMVSEDSCPGSRKCTWISIKPGATIRPLASKISASAGAAIFPAGPTSFIFSPSSRTSRGASVLDAGSTTRPFLISSIGGFLGFYFERGMSVSLRSAAGQQIENSHANRHPVGDLFEHTRLRPVGDFRGDFDASVDRAGMQNNGVPVGAAEPLSVELIEKDVIVGGKRRIIQPLRLHAQHDDHVRAFQRLLDPVHAANRRARCDFFQLSRNPHCRSAQREAAAEFSQQMNVRTRHAAVQNVAQNRHIQIFDCPQPVADG